jgi:lipid-binding SYLF domain-containing protein
MRLAGLLVAVAALGASLTVPGRVVAVGPRADAATIDRDAAAALRSLYATTPAAKTLGSKAKGILVFPKIVKAGFMVGAQYGDGALIKNGKTAGYYNITAGSYGFQAGVQSFGYAMFFMTDDALGYLDRTGGFEVGTGPSVVLVDEGMAKSMTTTTTRSDVYSFIFGQRGLMAGVGLQGSKITKINP